jgi:hypothetical protein
VTGRRAASLVGVGALLLGSVAIAQTSREPAPERDEDRSLRTVERLRWDCYSSLGRREVTLFGNGTVRLRSGLEEKQAVWLAELGPVELDAYLKRLFEIDFAETPEQVESVEGQWVERCQLSLDLPEGSLLSFEFGRYESLDLALRRAVAIAEDLMAEVDTDAAPLGMQTLPLDYRPRQGDVLRRVDGVLFEVIGQTADKLGWELQGVVQPLTLYIPSDQIREQFVALEDER